MIKTKNVQLKPNNKYDILEKKIKKVKVEGEKLLGVVSIAVIIKKTLGKK